MRTKKSQFGFDTAIVFLVILIIIVFFNVWRSSHLNKTKVVFDIKSNDLLKIYPILDYHVLIDYNSESIGLNFYELVDLYLKTKDANLVNEYCKTLRDSFDLSKIYISIDNTEFEDCNDDVDASSIFTTTYGDREKPINIKIGMILKGSHEGIYFNFLKQYEKWLKEK